LSSPVSGSMRSATRSRAEVWSAELYDQIAAAGRGELAGGRE